MVDEKLQITRAEHRLKRAVQGTAHDGGAALIEQLRLDEWFDRDNAAELGKLTKLWRVEIDTLMHSAIDRDDSPARRGGARDLGAGRVARSSGRGGDNDLCLPTAQQVSTHFGRRAVGNDRADETVADEFGHRRQRARIADHEL